MIPLTRHHKAGILLWECKYVNTLTEGEYVDYHLAPDPLPGPLLQSSAPPSIQTEGDTNVTAVLGQTVKLSCTVMGFRQEEHTVSWTKKYKQENPIALTFNDKVIPVHFLFLNIWEF